MASRKVVELPFTLEDGKLILQVHTKGDKRFSPFCCSIDVWGVSNTIEEHYQGCKLIQKPNDPESLTTVEELAIKNSSENWRVAQLSKAGGYKHIGWHFINAPDSDNYDLVDPKAITLKDMGLQFYIYLWYKYLKTNEGREKLIMASFFDGYCDPFEGTFPFGQAKVWEFVKERPSLELLQQCKDFVTQFDYP